MVTTRPVRHRTGSSYRALRVYWPMRWRLLWAARTDRRAGLPVGLSCDSTPVLRGLVARRDDVCERERARFLVDVARFDARLAALGTELPALQRLVDARSAALARVSPGPAEAELTERRAGERDLPAELVRQRRLEEWQRAVTTATAALEEAQSRCDAAQAEQADLRARRLHRADVVRSRAIRFCKHTDRLAAIYRRALVRRHPQREALIERWQTELSPLPAWVSADDPAPSARGVAA